MIKVDRAKCLDDIWLYNIKDTKVRVLKESEKGNFYNTLTDDKILSCVFMDKNYPKNYIRVIWTSVLETQEAIKLFNDLVERS